MIPIHSSFGIRSNRAALWVCAAVAALWLSGLADAQAPWGGGGRRFRRPEITPTTEYDRTIFPGDIFTFCSMEYQSVVREDGGWGWSTDFPDAGYNFMIRLSEMTTIKVNREPNGEPHQVHLPITDPALSHYPLLFSTDVGTADFSEAEVKCLREYLLRGGFLHVDDFWGDAAWARWSEQIGRVLPPDEFPIFDLPLDHPVFHIIFNVKEVPQVPSIHFWRRSGGQTSERGQESATPHLRGINDKNGRLMVIMSFNTDLGDGWEREGESQEYFEEFSVKKSYPLGINIVVYAMTH